MVNNLPFLNNFNPYLIFVPCFIWIKSGKKGKKIAKHVYKRRHKDVNDEKKGDDEQKNRKFSCA